jgi:hypothetical protein
LIKTYYSTKEFLAAREKIYARVPISAEHLINCDETLLTVKNKGLGTNRVVGDSNRGTVGGKLPAVGSALKFVNAAGRTILTVYVLKCSATGKATYTLRDAGRLRGHTRGHGQIRFAFNETGRMNGSLWANVVKCLCEVLEREAPGVTNLLLCDNVSCHHDLGALEYGHQHNLEFLFLPPNSTHFMQPLDDTLYASFKNVIAQEFNTAQVTAHLQKGGTNAKSVVLQVVHYAFTKAFTPANVKKSWANTGLYPFDKALILKRALANVEPSPETAQRKTAKVAYDACSDMLSDRTKEKHTAGSEAVEADGSYETNYLYDGREIQELGQKRKADAEAAEAAKEAKKAQIAAKKVADAEAKEARAAKAKEAKAAKAAAAKEAKAAKEEKARAVAAAKAAAAAAKALELLQTKCQACGTVRRSNQVWKEEQSCRLCERFLVCGKCDGSDQVMRRHTHRCTGSDDAEAKRPRKRRVLE